MTIETLYDHLGTCATTVARAWSITRRDGLVLGFTDCDLPLSFDGVTFAAEAGMTAKAVQQSSGLSVDNSEAMGVLTDDRITEADINAGLYDAAVVRAWLVNWHNVEDRKLIFKGSLGEIRRQGGAFDVELRGLADALNQPQGRVYQKPCSAVLGDGACGFDLTTPGFFADTVVDRIENRDQLIFSDLTGFGDGWFSRGRVKVLSGAGASIVGWIKSDRTDGADRVLTLWEPLRADIQPGDQILLHPGCDKRAATCRNRFDNLVNFQGFPFIPGDDWTAAIPAHGDDNTGEALV